MLRPFASPASLMLALSLARRQYRRPASAPSLRWLRQCALARRTMSDCSIEFAGLNESVKTLRRVRYSSSLSPGMTKSVLQVSLCLIAARRQIFLPSSVLAPPLCAFARLASICFCVASGYSFRAGFAPSFSMAHANAAAGEGNFYVVDYGGNISLQGR